jgi:acyl-CoA synthetase (NDP forming)
MKDLLCPQSIAIVGASAKQGKVGNILAANIVEYEYVGKYYFVNAKGGDILGQEAYTTLADAARSAGGKIDVVLIAVPAEYVIQVVKEGIAFCKNYVVISAGFGESDMEGHNREIKLKQLADREELTIIGPNCLGFITPSQNLNASFAPGMPRSGSVAFISQSGALAVALVDRATEIGIGFSSVVSIGNKMDVDAARLIEYFAQDENTDVITLYLEGIKDGEAFLKSAQVAHEQGKAVVLLKSGRSTQAQNAIALHTGSLAGDDDVTSAACRKAGVVRVDTIAELFALTRMAQDKNARALRDDYLGDRARGNDFLARVAIVTNAGGPGVITTDAIASTKNLQIETFKAEQTCTLKEALPPAASVHNPIDLLGDAKSDRYKLGIDFCRDAENIDVVMVLLTPQKNTPSLEVAHQIIDLQNDSKKIVIASFIGGEGVAEARTALRAAGILHFDTPTEAIRALDQLIEVTHVHRISYEIARNPQMIAASDLKRFEVMIDQAPYGAAYFDEAREIAQQYGVYVSDYWDVTRGIHADVTYPCVAKVDHPGIMHKSDRGGVILPIGSAAQLDEARLKLLERFPEDGVRIVAQPLRKIQTELIVGMKRDSTFGPVILVGMGGIYTEVFRSSQLFISPISLEYVVDELMGGPLTFLFQGARGQTPYDAISVANVVMSLMRLSEDMRNISAIDINPLLIYNEPQDDQKTVCAVDVKMVYKDSTE